MPLVVVPRDIILDDIAATIRRLRITHLDLTPSLARLLDPKDVPTLCRGVFITGGEALKQEILDTWGPRGVIYNAYGPTEATIGVTMYQRVPQNGRASNIGRQFDNVGTYVFEPGTEKPVLRGAVGELCISGKLVGKGYLNRPELTAERFPVLEHFKEKIYRTGDLVRVMYDGCFEFLGRADDQVKLRGQRLEIGEINHAIRTGVAAVKDVVTLVAKHPKVDKDLLVTFVTSSEAATSNGELHVLGGAETFKLRQTVLKACRHRLPGYMVPSYVLEVPFIPLSINNKAEMKILRHLFSSLTPELLLHVSAPAPSQEALATTKTQKTVLRAVSKFSGVSASELSLNSNLFDLGIDSISCLRLSRLLKHDGLRTADPALILKNPFLGDLAEALNKPYDREFLSASAVLSLWSGTFGKYFSSKAAMGVIVSGRALDTEDVEDVMGPLFNTLPFYPDVATNNTLQKLAQRCHDFNVSTLPFQHTALRNIQKWCSGGHPIFDNLFVYQNDVPLANNAETFWTVEDSFVANDYPLAFEATAMGDADLQVQIVVRQDVATEADIQRILEDFEEAIKLSGRFTIDYSKR
ncbi:hypothetical protein ACHAP6_008180 [Verticillium nonalfalfae]